MALNIVIPLLETYNSNIYTLVAIDHYSKWCKTKAIIDHDVETIARFLENGIICRFGVPKYVLTNYGFEWVAKFDQLCKNYEIVHQCTTP